MWNSKRAVIIVMVSWMAVVPVCRAATDDVVSGRELLRAMREKNAGSGRPSPGSRKAHGAATTAETGRPTAMKLLDKYAETQDRLRSSFISKHDTAVKSEGYDPARPAVKKGILYEEHMKTELRSDGSKHYSFNKRWGDNPGMHPTTEEHANMAYSLWDGELHYQFVYHLDTPAKARLKNGSLFLTPKAKLRAPPSRMCDLADGGPLRGFFYGSSERIDSDIRRAEKISVRPDTEEINGSQCYVISARTKRCEYKIWIDPKHDYHIAKAIVNRNWASASRPETRRTPPPDGTTQIVVENVLFKKVDNIWLPVECDHTMNIEAKAGIYSRSQYHHKVTEYLVNPDHEALGSFKPDFVRNGARVGIIGVKGIEYTWRDGKVVDWQGREVDIDALMPKELLGKALPKLAAFKLKLESGQTEDRMILLCFWDMNQRPSRSYVQRLNKRAKVLARKGVFVVLVHAARAEKGKLEAWLEKRKIALPVGRIEGNAEKVLRDWGVKALPWLILTDEEHIVTVEGFAIDELDMKFKEKQNP